MSAKADQPVLGHFNPCPLLIVVSGSDFPVPVSLRVMRMAGISSPFQRLALSIQQSRCFLP